MHQQYDTTCSQKIFFMTMGTATTGRAVLHHPLIDGIASLWACSSTSFTNMLRRKIEIYAKCRQQDTYFISKVISMTILYTSTINGVMQCLWRSRPPDEGISNLYQDTSILNFLASPTNPTDYSHYITIQSSVNNEAREHQLGQTEHRHAKHFLVSFIKCR